MRLNDMHPAEGAKFGRRRLGRGCGSGLGKTCGHGHKGQKARSGYSRRAGFEGGQMPIYRRLPKMGFTSKLKVGYAQLTLTQLDKLARGGVSEITLPLLKEKSLVSSAVDRVKVIGSGKLENAVRLGENIRATSGARSAIEACGGSVV